MVYGASPPDAMVHPCRSMASPLRLYTSNHSPAGSLAVDGWAMISLITSVGAVCVLTSRVKAKKATSGSTWNCQLFAAEVWLGPRIPGYWK